MNPKMTLLKIIPLLLAVVMPFAGIVGPAVSETAYPFTSFRGSGDGLHLACSTDGRSHAPDDEMKQTSALEFFSRTFED